MTLHIPKHALSFSMLSDVEVEEHCEGVPEEKTNETAVVYFVLQQFDNTTQKWMDVGALLATNFTDSGVEREIGKKLSSADSSNFPNNTAIVKYKGKVPHRIEIRTNTTETVIVKVGIVTNGSYGSIQPWLGLVVMVIAYALITTEVAEKALVSLAAMFVTLLLLVIGHKEFSLEYVAQWLDQATFVLLFGMMIIVKIFGDTGFFEWVSAQCIRLSKGSVRVLFVLILSITAFFSAFLDNVTTVLLSSPITVKACELLEISPVPFLIGQAVASNIGGTATLIGDPPNIIIGSMLKEHVSFNSFIINLGPFVIVTYIVVLLFLMYWWKNSVAGRRSVEIETLLEENKIQDKTKFIKCTVILLLVLIFFFLSSVLHIEPSWIALAGCVALMLLTFPKHIETPLSGVEWNTLVFFAALFVFINGMAKLGIIRLISNIISNALESVSQKNQLFLAMTMILWFSAVLSAIISSIPTTTTFVPVIKELMANPALNLRITPLIWSLSIGACFGGNGTLVGAPANIIVSGIVRSKGYFITFGSFTKVGSLVLFISVALANVYLIIFYGLIKIDL